MQAGHTIILDSLHGAPSAATHTAIDQILAVLDDGGDMRGSVLLARESGLARLGRRARVFAAATALTLTGAAPALAVDWDGFYAGITAGGGFGTATGAGSAGGTGCLVDGTVYDIVGDESQITQWWYTLQAGGTQQDGPIGIAFRPELLDDLNLTVLTRKTATVSGFGPPSAIIYDEYALAPGAEPKALTNRNVPSNCTLWDQAAADYLAPENNGLILSVPYTGGPPTSRRGDVVDGSPTPGGSTAIRGLAGGARVGYLREFGGFVLGAEGEVFVAGINDGSSGIGPFGVISARFGYELDDTPVLLFTNLGVAFGQLSQGSSTALGMGVSAGAGVEYQMADGLSVRAETRVLSLSNKGAGMQANAVLGLIGVSKKL